MDRRARLLAALSDNADQLEALARQHGDIVAASQDANADDEHDPEGATIAFERQQVAALQEQLRRTRTEIEAALADGDDDRCAACGGPVGAERREARPTARTCIECARGAR